MDIHWPCAAMESPVHGLIQSADALGISINAATIGRVLFECRMRMEQRFKMSTRIDGYDTVDEDDDFINHDSKIKYYL